MHVVRHGEVLNPGGVLYGRLPGFPLSERGRQQASAVADRLRGNDITQVVCSPLDRARQTALPIAAVHRVTPIVDDRLIEAGNVFEGRRVGFADVAWRNPRDWLRLYNPFSPSWSEPFATIAARMFAVLNDICRSADGHEAVCVSHQLPIWLLRRFCEGYRLVHDPRRRQCGYASLTSIEFRDGRISAIRYSEPASS